MKMKFGAIVVDGRGKIGGHVASKNRSGAYLRTKVTPVNAQTSFQLGVRNVFTGFAQAWRGLTQAQRDAWNAAVGDFTRTNVFGDSVAPTGFNLFQRLNNNLSIASIAQINVPPLPSEVGVVVADSLTAAVGVPAMSLVLTGAVPAGTAAKVFATAPMSAGKAFVKNLYRLIDVLPPAEGTPVDLLAAYTAKFGGTGTIGQKIYVKVEAINTTTGQTGQPSEVSVITVA
jgi:hypothetical protein